jgi:hypothetical protein
MPLSDAATGLGSSPAGPHTPLQLTGTEREALKELAAYPLTDALFQRRSRRFFRGATLPDGPLAFASRYTPEPLSELERLLLITTVAGKTGWHNGITRHDRYAPHLSNYPGSAGGRTFPSAAGFHTAETFFTDDTGTYFFATRDFPVPVERDSGGNVDVVELLEAHRGQIRKISDKRIHLPRREPYMEGHNTWVANAPGSLLIFPVGDLAQHVLLNIMFFAQNGFSIYDDVNHRTIPGIEAYADLVDVKNPYPLSFLDQYSLAEISAELALGPFAGQLLLQAMGLGGWIYNGIDRLTILGASGDPEVPGLGFRVDTDARWAQPNPTGLDGVFEAFTPPHHRDMRAAVEALTARKFGPGGPFNSATPGPWKESPRVRSSAQFHDERFKSLVALQAQYFFDTFGKFPATVPSVFVLMYLQAHHLDLEFYDHHFTPGAYLATHANHFARWHGRDPQPAKV